VTVTALPDSIARLSQDHIDMRVALKMLEREVASVAQYHPPDAVLIGGAVQFFAHFPARCHHPIEHMLFDVLASRAPEAATRVTYPAQHAKIIENIGELALMARNLFLDPPQWRVPFCATARAFIVQKRDHINGEEKTLFPLALEHLRPEDWFAIDHAAGAANAAWNDSPTNAGSGCAGA
jgi:hemerythrin-like domain-containing protein